MDEEEGANQAFESVLNKWLPLLVGLVLSINAGRLQNAVMEIIQEADACEEVTTAQSSAEAVQVARRGAGNPSYIISLTTSSSTASPMDSHRAWLGVGSGHLPGAVRTARMMSGGRWGSAGG